MVVGWVLTRLVIIAFMTTLERIVVGDVFYYWRKLEAMSSVGLGDTMTEYPTPVVWILSLPHLATFGSRVGYLVAFIIFMMALDAAFTWLLWRHGGRRRTRAIDFWLLYVMLIGPLAYLRFDMIPAVLAGGALLLLRGRPRAAGALVGLGAAIKLWPALLYPALLGLRPTRSRVTVGFVVTGFGLALVSLIAGGWSRLVSPLTWQSGRGLQIESIWATPLMLRRLFDPDSWVVDISPFQAYEIFGDGVEFWLLVSNVATVLGMLAIVVLLARGMATMRPSVFTVGLVMTAIIAVLVITNKTLSPQYLLWLGGPMSALLVWETRPAPVQDEVEESVGNHHLARRMGVGLLVLALLTHLVYPTFYDALLGRSALATTAVGTVIMAVRNVGLVLFTVWVCAAAWVAMPRRRRT